MTDEFAVKKKIVIVGGGPAGMMAGIRAGQFDQDVTLVEKNPTLGRKLLLSGKGRCNLTNTCDLELFLKRFSSSGPFLRDSFKKFFSQDLIRFFEDRGVKLKVERQLRVFPETDSSISILRALKSELEKVGVKIVFNTNTQDIIVRNKKAAGVLLDSSLVLPADKVVLATGGVSYAFTGSDGGGLSIAKKHGHSIVELRPGLVPLKTRQCYNGLEGLVLKNIRICFSEGKKKIVTDIGELLFTHFGISGPLVLSLSGKIVDWLPGNKQISARIDLKPALTKGQIDARLLREFKLQGKKDLKNALKDLLPLSFIKVFINAAGIAPGKKINQISQKERLRIVELFKDFPVEISGSLPIEEAMITRGGVSLKEVNPRTMGSRLVEGLYFAGEMLDIDADTGGFNLQAAFSTGYLAGESAATL